MLHDTFYHEGGSLYSLISSLKSPSNFTLDSVVLQDCALCKLVLPEPRMQPPSMDDFNRVSAIVEAIALDMGIKRRNNKRITSRLKRWGNGRQETR